MTLQIARRGVAFTLVALVSGGVGQSALAQGFDAGGSPGAVSPSGEQKLVLTPAQRRAIYAAVTKDKSKTAKTGFAPKVGADVPPMLELSPLPDEVTADNQSAKFFEYTLVQDKVVVVDPTRMRVVDVIGPPQ
jgi:Protein of unknown function (DUF1236)